MKILEKNQNRNPEKTSLTSLKPGKFIISTKRFAKINSDSEGLIVIFRESVGDLAKKSTGGASTYKAGEREFVVCGGGFKCGPLSGSPRRSKFKEADSQGEMTELETWVFGMFCGLKIDPGFRRFTSPRRIHFLKHIAGEKMEERCI